MNSSVVSLFNIAGVPRADIVKALPIAFYTCLRVSMEAAQAECPRGEIRTRQEESPTRPGELRI